MDNDSANKKIYVTIIGAGIVGSSSARGLLKINNQVTVTVCDKNPRTLASLRNEGFTTLQINEISNASSDFYFICVDTPYSEDIGFNLENLEQAMKDVATAIKKHTDYQVVVIRSTVPPGTTRKLIPIIEKHSGKKSGKDFGVCFHPEYLRAKTADSDFINPNLIVIAGLDSRSQDTLAHLYKNFDKVISYTNFETAEAAKLISNVINAVKISMFNDLRTSLEALDCGINVQQAIELASFTAESSYNRQYGILPLGPYAGGCLPKDTKGLRDFFRQHGIASSILNATIEINESLLGK